MWGDLLLLGTGHVAGGDAMVMLVHHPTLMDRMISCRSGRRPHHVASGCQVTGISKQHQQYHDNNTMIKQQ